MDFNQDPTISCNELLLYRGDMTLVPHQGNPRAGTGSIELACGPANRHLRISFKSDDNDSFFALPGSADRQYGAATSFMRLPVSEDFFVFVTSMHSQLIGESRVITGNTNEKCIYFDVYLLNCLTPSVDTSWNLSDWLVSSVQTNCAYDLTRVSLPTHEFNLTHKLTITHKNQKTFSWLEISTYLDKLLLFLSFANCSRISAPVIYGYRDGKIQFIRFQAPRRSVPTNRRSWATEITQADLGVALSRFLKTLENEFWLSVFERAIDWQTLADASTYDSIEQALFTVQMLLELLSYVLLVEEAMVLGEAGYNKLPASDKITLLCSRSNQEITAHNSEDNSLSAFCSANSINNVGELITALRNKLVHPTKKNRQYLDQVPSAVRWTAVALGLQIASLTILKVINYRGMYYDMIEHQSRIVPWIQ